MSQPNASETSITPAAASTTTITPTISPAMPAQRPIASGSRTTRHVDDEHEPRVTKMFAMLEKYSQNFPIHRRVDGSNNGTSGTGTMSGLGSPAGSATTRQRTASGGFDKDTILLTGGTGALGATLLASLVSKPEVERVYVLNRKNPSGIPPIQRQMNALVEVGFDAEAVVRRSRKVILLESDMPEEKLGLEDEMYQEIQANVTHIIHSAYLVNLNLPIEKFEPNVKTLRHLVDLALSSPRPSPPRLLFISSEGVWTGRADNYWGNVKEVLNEPEDVIRCGYGESKWVCEHILGKAEGETPLRPTVVRVGQISGGPSGAWNSHDWVPAMVKSGIRIGSLPVLDEEVTWVPVDAVGRAVTEMRNSKFLVHHIQHPNYTPWNAMFVPMAKHLHLSTLPYEEWLNTIESHAEGLKSLPPAEARAMKRSIPALSLLWLFRPDQGIAADGGTGRRFSAPGQIRFDMENTLTVVPAMKELPPISGRDALRWLYFWKKKGVLDWKIRPTL